MRRVAVRPLVLVVDDAQANLVALVALLAGMDCEVVPARSGEEALRCLGERRYAVALLDVQMPEMDGYELARRARETRANQDLPILFLTASHNTEETLLRGYGSGAVDFLFKPINPTVLRSKVRVFLELFVGRKALAEANQELEQQNASLTRAYAELQATQSQLVQSAKMASLGELVAGVAHEINNPLAFVLSHLDTTRRSLAQFRAELSPTLAGKVEDHWQRAQSRLLEMALGLERIRDLVLKLRAFSRLDEGELQSVSMRESVESLLTIIGHRTEGRITVETQFGDPDVIECYPALLNQALLNLVVNSIDAIDGEGKIVISAGMDGNQYALSVSDTGSGIPDDILERVVEPFFTTKAIGQGTGLGLSITFSIVKKHGGTLALNERAGGGTEAIIRFPLQRRPESSRPRAGDQDGRH